MDVLFIDECGQWSAQQLAILDIILRNARKSSIPFGGVLIFTTMDHAQLGAIQGLPLLLSSHILTDFVLVKLKESVRSYGDEDFQTIQNITRMNPKVLLNDDAIKKDFYRLMSEKLTYVKNWNDPAIDHNVQRMYAKRRPVQEAAEEFIRSTKQNYDANSRPYSVRYSEDTQKIAASPGTFHPLHSMPLLNHMNTKLDEPAELLFFDGAMFEATTNGNNYSQSQLLLMRKMPQQHHIESFSPLELFAAPAGIQHMNITNIPSEEHLLANGWKKVTVGLAPESTLQLASLLGMRKQYALRHVGFSTINKQMGNTITGKCAIEITKDCSPWQKEQAVVLLSRTTCAENTIIVGDKNWAIDRIWSLITQQNQWTNFIEDLLERLSVNGAPSDELSNIFRYSDNYPYRVSDIQLPTDSSGFVYLLASVKDFDRTYTGETTNLPRRLYQHNSGYGSKGTRTSPLHRPYFVAAYICGLSHLNKGERMSLEGKWKLKNRNSINGANGSLLARVRNGETVVKDYNANQQDLSKHIRLMITMKFRNGDSIV